MTAYMEESDFGIGMHRNKYMKFLKEIYRNTLMYTHPKYIHAYVHTTEELKCVHP